MNNEMIDLKKLLLQRLERYKYHKNINSRQAGDYPTWRLYLSGVNQLGINYLCCMVTDVIHPLHPQHLILSF